LVATGGAAAAGPPAAVAAAGAAAAARLTLPFDFSFSFFAVAAVDVDDDDEAVVAVAAAVVELLPDELLLLPFDCAAVEGDPLLFRWLLFGRLEEDEFAVSLSVAATPPPFAFLFVLLGPEGFELAAEEVLEESLPLVAAL